MSGNSKQRKQDRKFNVRFLSKLRDVLDGNIRPMIKEESQAEFNEVIKGLDDLLEEARAPQKQAPDLKGF